MYYGNTRENKFKVTIFTIITKIRKTLKSIVDIKCTKRSNTERRIKNKQAIEIINGNTQIHPAQVAEGYCNTIYMITYFKFLRRGCVSN